MIMDITLGQGLHLVYAKTPVAFDWICDKVFPDFAEILEPKCDEEVHSLVGYTSITPLLSQSWGIRINMFSGSALHLGSVIRAVSQISTSVPVVIGTDKYRNFKSLSKKFPVANAMYLGSFPYKDAKQLLPTLFIPYIAQYLKNNYLNDVDSLITLIKDSESGIDYRKPSEITSRVGQPTGNYQDYALKLLKPLPPTKVGLNRRVRDLIKQGYLLSNGTVNGDRDVLKKLGDTFDRFIRYRGDYVNNSDTQRDNWFWQQLRSIDIMELFRWRLLVSEVDSLPKLVYSGVRG